MPIVKRIRDLRETLRIAPQIMVNPRPEKEFTCGGRLTVQYHPGKLPKGKPKITLRRDHAATAAQHRPGWPCRCCRRATASSHSGSRTGSACWPVAAVEVEFPPSLELSQSS